MNLQVTQETQYTYFSFPTVRDREIPSEQVPLILSTDMNDVANLIFVTLDDYNAGMGTEKSLADNEILLYANRLAYEQPNGEAI
ncbi:MAG: hypothetical protein ACLVAT_07975 [Lachnospiraceae bacterium]